jgi:MarR family transcriptional regulator, organic hydroperoxide resistance regulator
MSAHAPEAKVERTAGFGAWLAIAFVYQRHHRVLTERLRPLDVSVAQLDVLANLAGVDAMQQKELAARLLVTKANVTGLVDRLVERGWVERQADPADGRAHRVVLTRVGRKVAQRALEVRHALIAEIFEVLTPDERATLTELAHRVGARLGELGG